MKKFTLLFLSLSLCLSLTVFANAASTKFTDVPTGTWFYTAVMGCADKGYVSGVGNNKFMPDGKLTYAQIFTMFTNAFYKAEKQSYENNRYLEMDAYFGGKPQWYGYNAFYFNDNGLLKGVDVNIQSTASANAPISRYDVAQIANNILKNKGITVSEAQKTQARNTIADWNSIPADYQEAVASCFSLGIISGYTDGRFGGNDTLTRAQACVILNSLEKVVIAGPQSGNSSNSSDSSSNGTSTDGVLANGKAITEENVLELLSEIEKKYPTGTLWTDDAIDPNTNYNPNTVSGAVKAVFQRYHLSTKYACSGFAAMVSDLVFGTNGNYLRQLNNIADIRPGDIILRMKGKTVDHVMVAMSTAKTVKVPSGGENYYGNNPIRVNTADGNNNNQVYWPNTTSNNSCLIANGSTFPYTFVVYTRYPA